MASERGKEVEQSSVVTKEGRTEGSSKDDRKIKTLYEADVIKATNKML